MPTELKIIHQKQLIEMENKYITVAYKLYSIEDGEREFTEEATVEHPFQFISGLGLTLDAFEEQIKGLNAGDKFAPTHTANMMKTT